ASGPAARVVPVSSYQVSVRLLSGRRTPVMSVERHFKNKSALFEGVMSFGSAMSYTYCLLVSPITPDDRKATKRLDRSRSLSKGIICVFRSIPLLLIRLTPRLSDGHMRFVTLEVLLFS